ncbi:hypothetical protein PV458_25710 [Streptomyces sp. MN03-5084-2B]|nr:hypothetical protein [Streptomyces sp. MN03-5084-2B]
MPTVLTVLTSRLPARSSPNFITCRGALLMEFAALVGGVLGGLAGAAQ